MTQLTKSFFAGIMLCFGFITITVGQNMYASNQAIATGTANTIASDESNNAYNLTATTPRVAASFLALFPHATEQKWSNIAGDSFVSFLNNGQKATARFDEKGNMSYSIVACSLDQLPVAFSKAIKRNYAAYQLYHASEIQAHGGTTYQAILETGSRFITLKFTVDGLEEVQSVRK